MEREIERGRESKRLTQTERQTSRDGRRGVGRINNEIK